MSENTEKNNQLGEVIRFCITGGVCFLIELAALILLRDKAGLDTLIATPIAFLIVNHGEVSIKHIAGEGGQAERIIGMVPDVIDKVTGAVEKFTKKGDTDVPAEEEIPTEA